jgi:hypothetical protein
MSFHSYNHGMVSSAKGVAVEFAVVTGLDVSPAADAECTVNDLKSNFVDTVIHSATGVYDVQINKPYPAELYCVAQLSAAAVAHDLLHARYVDDSYDPDAGTFQVVITNDDDNGAGVAAAGLSTNQLMLFMYCQRYTNI